MLKRVFVSILLAGTLAITFQNCSRGDDTRSMAYVIKNETPNPVLVADTGLSDNLDGLSSGNIIHQLPVNNTTSGDSLSSLDSLSCFQSYISVFEWKNPTANLMSEKPLLGSTKLVSLNLTDGVFSTEKVVSGWRIESTIKIAADGKSYSTVQFLKADPASSDSLDCYFMRALDSTTLQAGLANVLFKNVGADVGANIFAGFLRNQEQFIACKVSSGHGEIELRNSGEASEILSVSQAFVLKRGCYPTQSSSTN